MTKKNIAVCIILSIVTCGIYGIIWFIEMTNDTARANENKNLNGGTAFLLTLLTCGIYSFYWNYKIGKEIYEAQQKKNLPAKDNSTLYLILSIIGLQIVNYCLIQSDLNNMAD